MMFDFDLACDCGKRVVDGLWPCKHCGRPDPSNRIDAIQQITLNAWPKPRFLQEISFVFKPYVPTIPADEIVSVQPLAPKEK
ncbi:MAG: hypothetical protein JRG69_12135 [Deltaproteobacteria bacterium]|nr:hypothetical protein [Deltaproteobacteria bacterium]